jgi:hypothetical protein
VMFTPALGSEGTQQLTGAYVPDAGFNPRDRKSVV